MGAPTWIFGYGSLIWRPDFPSVERRAAWVEGWARRFWQGSTDHRGRPGAPGRVVTLVPAPGARCWGAAYRLPAGRAGEILARLDARERGGYERRRILLHWPGRAGRRGVAGILYRATPRNRNYLGPARLEAIAAQVRRSTGPSGSNRDYVLQLARSLARLGAPDPHVCELVLRLREHDRGAQAPGQVPAPAERRDPEAGCPV